MPARVQARAHDVEQEQPGEEQLLGRVEELAGEVAPVALVAPVVAAAVIVDRRQAAQLESTTPAED